MADGTNELSREEKIRIEALRIVCEMAVAQKFKARTNELASLAQKLETFITLGKVVE